MLQENLKGISKMFQGWVFQGRLKGFSREFSVGLKGNFREDFMLFQGCFMEVSSVL